MAEEFAFDCGLIALAGGDAEGAPGPGAHCSNQQCRTLQEKALQRPSSFPARAPLDTAATRFTGGAALRCAAKRDLFSCFLQPKLYFLTWARSRQNYSLLSWCAFTSIFC
jgi:hypothetical protein